MKSERSSYLMKHYLLGCFLLLSSTIIYVRADTWDELYYNTGDLDAEEIQFPGPIDEWSPLRTPVTADPPEPSLDEVDLPDEIELISPEPELEQIHDGVPSPDGHTIPLEQQQQEELDDIAAAPVATPEKEPTSAEPQFPDPVCSPPTSEEPGLVEVPAPAPETKTDNSDKSVPKNKRMLVQFVVTMNGLTETSFESRGRGILVQAIKDAARQFGAKSDVHVRIVKVWRWTKSNRRFLLQSHLAATAEASEGLKVQAQTRFEEEDAAAALEFTDALSTSPTSIFHEQEFGDITVPDVDLVPISGSNSWIPIVLGAAAGLAVCTVVAVVYLKKQSSSYRHAHIPEEGGSLSVFGIREDDQDKNQYIRASWTHDEKSCSDPPANSRLHLLGSISSKKYTAPSDTYSGRELVVNNLGLYSYNK